MRLFYWPTEALAKKGGPEVRLSIKLLLRRPGFFGIRLVRYAALRRGDPT